MKRKILIFNLLFALALLPVAQAVMPVSAPVESTHTMPMNSGHTMPMSGGHEMPMNCSQGDHGDCLKIDCCSGGSHASCDASAKATQVSSRTAEHPDGPSYDADPLANYLSHPIDLLLRPPRIA